MVRSRRSRARRARFSISLRDIVPAAPSDVPSRPALRIGFLALVGLSMLTFMVLRLWSLQVVNHNSFSAVAHTNQLRNAVVPAPRGTVVDRNGTVLVTVQGETQVVISKEAASQHAGVISRLAALLGVSPTELEATINNKQYLPYQPVPVLSNPSPEVRTYLAEHVDEFPGVEVIQVTRRGYPQGGTTANHVLGYVGQVSATDLTSDTGHVYGPTSPIGKDGIEKYYEPYLRGKDGSALLEVNVHGQIVGTLKHIKPTTGDTVALNLDTGLQQHVERVLADAILRDRKTVDSRSNNFPPAINGAVVALDVRNGAVLAMASYPSYDLNSWVGGISTADYAQIAKVGGETNYAVSGQFVPGSTFKLITAIASLKNGLMAADQYVPDFGKFVVPNCKKYGHGCVFKDDEAGGAGMVNLVKALTVSSDYYFYNLGYLFWASGKRFGDLPIQSVGAQLGLATQTGVDLPNESSGFIDSAPVRLAHHAATTTWYAGDNIEMAFGQGATVVTPLAMANAYATFANGGTRYAPEIVGAILKPNGQMVTRFGPKVVAKMDIPDSVRRPILEGLIGVTQNPEGTGYRAFQDFAHFDQNAFPIAGKTGTASNSPGQEPNSWFVGFGPANNPRYVVLCVIGQGGYGASAAAPVVAQTFNYLVANEPGPIVLPSRQHPTHLSLPPANPPAGS
ncbi:MAG: penicillin-binding protein 2 [Actinobacteria bacterium]|nr:penicillin-binding protein 2 [Actinomycetota bacterium]